MNYKKALVALIIPSMLSSFVQAGAGSQAGNKDKADSPIQQIDFLNFTYHPSVCAKEFGKGGIGKAVLVRNGEFKNNEVYYGVVNNQIIYGDLTHDGKHDAVVHIVCGYFSANYGLSELFVFATEGNAPILLASINENDIERDYRTSYPGVTTWRIIDDGVRVVKGDLVVKLYAEGAHCCPDYVAAIRYRWNGTSLARVGKIEREKFVSNQ
jgi:hypothetical protein